MFGWFRAEAARASRRKRSRAPQFLRQIVRKKLEGDRATELEILGPVDHTHPATAQLLDDAVVRDGLTDHADRSVPGATMLGAIQRASQCSRGKVYSDGKSATPRPFE